MLSGLIDEDVQCVAHGFFSYEQTANEFKTLYIEKQKFAVNYPDYDSL